MKTTIGLVASLAMSFLLLGQANARSGEHNGTFLQETRKGDVNYYNTHVKKALIMGHKVDQKGIIFPLRNRHIAKSL